MPRRPGTKADVVLGEVPADTVGLEIVQKVAAKGFCVVAPGFEEGLLASCLQELQAFERQPRRWGKLNSIIQDGLLGAEGSCFTAELPAPDEEEEPKEDGDFLAKLDYTVSHVGMRMEPYLEHLGFEVSHRGLAIVHQSGEPDEDEEAAPLTEPDVMKWLGTFMRHKLMVCVFLGPTTGTLELLPYDQDETDIHEVHTESGMIVVLRPDLMSHKFYSPSRSFVFSAFFLSGALGKHGPKEGWPMIPPARELDEWSLQRLKDHFEEAKEGRMISALPSDWRNAMNHIFHRGQMVCVRGSCVKASMTEDISTLWQVSTVAPDYVTEVPMLRWDHTEVFDPDFESWRQFKSYCRHASFMDGIELFDCKMFSMSPNEAKAIDPHQRLILEIGYAALHTAGLRKNSLVNSACGVYVGCGNLEWNFVPKDESSAFGATGAALSISSGRFSFTLGLKGPSMTLDTEASSGGTAVHLGADAMEKKGRAATNELSLAIGANIVLSPMTWPTLCAQGVLSPEGRCFSFNATAAGWVRADGCTAIAMRLMSETVDGEEVPAMEEVGMGALAGSTMNNNGRSAGLTAPNGPAEQEAVADAVRNANISVYDVDHVEAFGVGSFLADAIEVGSFLRAHRSEEIREPLPLTAQKSSFGNQVEASAITAFLKTLQSAEWATMTPMAHLHQANPHIEASEQPALLLTEALEYKMQSAFAGNMSRGNGGSNAYLLSWGCLNYEKAPTASPAIAKEVIAFWPGGGGALEREKAPAREYSIVGSWGQFPEVGTMEPEGDGVYGYTVTLGENRWEWFLIWLDGDANRVLHPGYCRASKDFPVLGPVEDAEGACWLIDGRPEYVAVEGEDELREVPTADYGRPGDQYRVHLRVAGKWRIVDWERLNRRPNEADEPALAVPIVGRYYVTGDWNDWELLELQKGAQPGCFSLDFTTTRPSHEFQLLRNKDWCQAIYPATNPSASEALGPDDQGVGYCWKLQAPPGTAMRIEFQRQQDGKSDEMRVTWARVEALPA